MELRPGREPTANIATPIVRGNHVFLSSDYGTGAALLELTPGPNRVTAREVYFTREMRNHHASSVLIGDHLYGFSDAILTAMKFDTGQVAWRDRSVGKGSLVFADDRLYLYSEHGVVGLAEANPAGYREHGRFQIRAGNLPDLEPSRRLERQAVHSRSGHDLRLRRHGQVNSRLTDGLTSLVRLDVVPGARIGAIM